MDLIAEGIKKKLIRLEDHGKYIVYVHQDKRRNYANPEEKVQAESFLRRRQIRSRFSSTAP